MAKNLETNTNQAVNSLLNKENEIINKFHNSITELLRLGYDSDRGKEIIPRLIESVQYSLEDLRKI